MKSLEQFQANLRFAMETVELSQRMIAEKSGLSYPYVNRVLTGAAVPSIDVCESLAIAVGLKLPDLLVAPKEFRKTFKKLSLSA